MSELKPCPFCKQARVKMLVNDEEWMIARASCQAHKCGALGPWVELDDFSTIADAKAKAAELWNTRKSSNQTPSNNRGSDQ